MEKDPWKTFNISKVWFSDIMNTIVVSRFRGIIVAFKLNYISSLKWNLTMVHRDYIWIFLRGMSLKYYILYNLSACLVLDIYSALACTSLQIKSQTIWIFPLHSQGSCTNWVIKYSHSKTRKAWYKTDDRNLAVSFVFSEMSDSPSRSTNASLWAGLMLCNLWGATTGITVSKGVEIFHIDIVLPIVWAFHFNILLN